MSSKARRDEIKRLICEGWDARVAGTNYQNCPSKYIGTMDRIHWQEGWIQADRATNFEESRLEELAGISDEEKIRRGSLIATTLLLTEVNGVY